MSQGENKPKTHKPTAKQMLVRYGQMGTLGWFDHHESHIPKTHTHVVIKTERGLELGQVVGEHCYKGGQFKSSPQQVENYYCNRTKDFPLGEGGQFVRFATTEDIHEQEHLKKNAINEAKACQRIAGELGLEMKIIEAEHLFGGERIIFYFTSEGRVDFRELVKRLAREYQTRIELRQIGSRDEARLISDYESCGQQCCCSRFLKILEPVNMRMAKLQKATLDPSKISGHCGRLKCLRYEDETYMSLKKSLPKRGAVVFTPKGQGKVVDMQILTQLVVVQDQLGDRQAWPVEEIASSAEELERKIKALEAKKAAEMPEQIEDMPILTEAEQASRSAERNNREGKQGRDGNDKSDDGQKRPRRNRRSRNRRRKPRGEGGDQQNAQGQQNQQKKNDGGQKQGGDNNKDGQQKKRPNNRNRRNRRNKQNNNQQNQNQGTKSDGGNQGNPNNKPANQPKPSEPKSSGPGGEQA